MNYPIMEHRSSINGVAGRIGTITEPVNIRGNMVNICQKWISEARPMPDYRDGFLTVTIRFDDQCKNGHQTFAITGSYRAGGGCCHDLITVIFPELAYLIKWHLVSTDGPMYYIANTVYHASNRDYNGLLSGETKQIRNGKTGLLCWKLETIPANMPQYIDADICPHDTAMIKYVPRCKVGEGKKRDFKAARSCAVWPEATDDQLSLEKADLTVLLNARLPQLIADFRADMESIGFLWEVSK
jgi:hypothetical protein